MVVDFTSRDHGCFRSVGPACGCGISYAHMHVIASRKLPRGIPPRRPPGHPYDVIQTPSPPLQTRGQPTRVSSSPDGHPPRFRRQRKSVRGKTTEQREDAILWQSCSSRLPLVISTATTQHDFTIMKSSGENPRLVVVYVKDGNGREGRRPSPAPSQAAHLPICSLD